MRATPPARDSRRETHGSGLATVEPMQSPAGAPLRNIAIASGAAEPVSAASKVKLIARGFAAVAAGAVMSSCLPSTVYPAGVD